MDPDPGDPKKTESDRIRIRNPAADNSVTTLLYADYPRFRSSLPTIYSVHSVQCKYWIFSTKIENVYKFPKGSLGNLIPSSPSPFSPTLLQGRGGESLPTFHPEFEFSIIFLEN